MSSQGLCHVLSKLVELLVTLSRFVSEDEKVAEDAYAKLCPEISKFLRRFLRKYLSREDDREDVIGKCLTRLWSKRSSFQVTTELAWWTYVANSGRWVAIDQGKQLQDTWPEMDPPSEDANFIRIVDRGEGDMLYSSADRLWLGLNTKSPNGRRKVLAAQLFYVHERQVEIVVRCIGRGIGKEAVAEWLRHEAVLLATCYIELYYGNDKLARRILGAQDLDDLTKRAHQSPKSEPPVGWSWEEVEVILWHYRNGLSAEKIVQMSQGPNRAAPCYSIAEIRRILDKCEQRLPFAGVASQLASAFKKHHVKGEPLRNPGLWRRLVFQYFSADMLPHRQILARTEPAASVCGANLNAGILNAWLSNSRILDQLVAYVQRSRNEP
jgi:hypothetical protein